MELGIHQSRKEKSVNKSNMPDILPSDGADSVLVGRIWDPNSQGPRVVAVRGEELVDLTPMFGTVSELLENDDPADLVLSSGSNVLPWALEEVVQNSATGDRNLPFLLAPRTCR